jgi:rubrerythrin
MKTKNKGLGKVMSYGNKTTVVPMAKPKATLPEYRCNLCGYTWIPRTNAPDECPKCRRRNWWLPEKR